MDEQYGYNDHHNQGNKRRLVEHSVELEKTPELPSQVIIWEILIRLPIKSLLRFKCVCKEWCLIQDDDVFINKHMNLTTPLVLRDCDALCSSDITTTATLSPAYSDQGYRGFSILGVFEGLVVGQLWNRYCFVRNPATRQRLNLPKTTSPFHRMWFNFDSTTGEAKLLCEYSIREELISKTCYEILRIGIDKEWRMLKTPTRDLFSTVSRDQDSLHFISPVWTRQEGLVDIQVSSLDIRSECFSDTINFPRAVFSDLYKTFSFWWDNNLAFGNLDEIEKELHVLVLKKQEGNNNYKWRKNKIVVPLRFLRQNTFQKKTTLVFEEAISGDLWFHTLGRYKFCYDMETGRIKEKRLNEKDIRMFEY